MKRIQINHNISKDISGKLIQAQNKEEQKNLKQISEKLMRNFSSKTTYAKQCSRFRKY